MTEPLDSSAAPAANGQQGQLPTPPVTPAPVTPVTPVTPAAAPEGFVELHRLTKALQKIEQLTLENRQHVLEHTRLTTQVTELQQGAATASVAATTSTATLTAELVTAKATIADQAAKLADSEATKRKIEAITVAKQPQLLALLDVIPAEETPEAQLATVQRLSAFSANLVQQREVELTTGIVPETITPVVTVVPASADEWMAKINALPDGPEKETAWNGYFASTQPK